MLISLPINLTWLQDKLFLEDRRYLTIIRVNLSAVVLVISQFVIF